MDTENDMSGEVVFDSNSFDKMIEYFASNNLAHHTDRNYRTYNMEFTNGDESFKLENVISTRAGHLRSKYRKEGWRVSMFEVSNLTGIVNRVPDTLNGKGVPNPVNYDSPRLHRRTHAAAAKIRLLMMAKENNKLNREAIKNDNNRCRVYENSSGQLRFSGTIDEVAAYLINLAGSGNFNASDFTLYLPESKMGK